MSTEEKLQEAADNHAKVRRYKGDEYDYYNRHYAFIQGAKSPESLEYWKDKEKLYSEEEVIILLQTYRFDLLAGKTPSIGDTTGDWFEQNKKK